MPEEAIEVTAKVRPLIHTYGAVCQLLCAEMLGFEKNQVEELITRLLNLLSARDATPRGHTLQKRTTHYKNLVPRICTPPPTPNSGGSLTSIIRR